MTKYPNIYKLSANHEDKMNLSLKKIIAEHDLVLVDNSLNNVPQVNMNQQFYVAKRFSHIDRSLLRQFITIMKDNEILFGQKNVCIIEPIYNEARQFKEKMLEFKEDLGRSIRGLNEQTLKNKFYQDYWGQNKFDELLGACDNLIAIAQDKSTPTPQDPLFDTLNKGIRLLVEPGKLKINHARDLETRHVRSVHKPKYTNHTDEALFASTVYEAIKTNKYIALLTADYDFRRMFTKGISRLFSHEFSAINGDVRDTYDRNQPSVFIRNPNNQWEKTFHVSGYAPRCSFSHLSQDNNRQVSDRLWSVWREYYHQVHES